MELSDENTLEENVDELDYDQHENDYYGENPEDPEPFSILICVLVITERRGHWALPAKRTRSCLALTMTHQCETLHISLANLSA
jgi:hypothetical protein